MNENLDEIARVLSANLKAESREPSLSGIWYYVYLKGASPEWNLLVYPDEKYPMAGHNEVWASHVSSLLKDHYKFSPYQHHVIRDIPYCMPRGRMGKESGIWVFYHGDDFPSALDLEHEKNILITRFHLNLPAAQDKVLWKVVRHEMMNPREKEEFKEVTKVDVPY